MEYLMALGIEYELAPGVIVFDGSGFGANGARRLDGTVTKGTSLRPTELLITYSGTRSEEGQERRFAIHRMAECYYSESGAVSNLPTRMDFFLLRSNLAPLVLNRLAFTAVGLPERPLTASQCSLDGYVGDRRKVEWKAGAGGEMLYSHGSNWVVFDSAPHRDLHPARPRPAYVASVILTLLGAAALGALAWRRATRRQRTPSRDSKHGHPDS